MITDALEGQIDLIVTKSVSRFARNTVDSLTTVRQLKEKGVEVYFEKENIYTLDSKGELLITIMSSLAQEESRSISENVTWGWRKRFSDGKVSMPYKQFLGYRKGDDDKPEIVEEEAEIVRRIYRLFLEGKTPIAITKILEADGVLSPAGKEKWQTATVLSILSNEKYKGDALLQKTFCTDFLTKKIKVNEGEIPQYYVTDSHPAIVTDEVFDMVQREIAQRKKNGKQHNCTSHFSGKIRCGCCNGLYGSKVWHSNSKYRSVIWQCNAKFKDGHKCDTPHLTEEAIQQTFIEAFNRLLTKRTFISQDIKAFTKKMMSTTLLEDEAATLREDMEVTAGLLQQAISQNASMALDQEDFNRRYASLSQRYNNSEKRLNEIECECIERRQKLKMLRSFVAELMKQDEVVTEFSSALWNAMVEKMVIQSDGRVSVVFRNGTEIRA